MLKKVLLIVVFLLLVAGWIYQLTFRLSTKQREQASSPKLSPTAPVTFDVVSETAPYSLKKSIFVPSWSEWESLASQASPGEAKSDESYDRLIYFGVGINSEGIIKDAAHAKLKDFSSAFPNQKKWLTLKMTDMNINLEILKNEKNWGEIIDETLSLAKDYGFEGVVLDLEMSALPFDNVVSQINKFVQTFYTHTQLEKISLALSLYGDLFYRKRPYDLAVLNSYSDEIMIMAYDFHKSFGEPGPNFPMLGREKYGYDFSQMLTDYKKFVSPKKISVVFGMYGYDWNVDEKKRPIKPARALSLNEIESKFINNCPWKNCVTKKDEVSKETEIDYVDDAAGFHIIWFENPDSVEEKLKLLKKEGIENIVYWAYGYF